MTPPLRLLPLLLLLAIIVASTGCVGQQTIDGGIDGGIVYSDAPNKGDCRVSDYDNNVLFFGCTGSSFASGLSQYIAKENVSVVSIAPVSSISTYNSFTGYIVVVKHK